MPVCTQAIDLDSLWQTVVGATVVTRFSPGVHDSTRSSERWG